MTKNASAGFTLIELLVVITMIGILAVGGFASYVNSQRTARDAKRKTDLETLRQGLEIYRTINGTYPVYTGDVNSNAAGSLKTILTGSNCNLSPCITAASYPQDPKSPSIIYYFSSPAGGATYNICALLENLRASDPVCGGIYDCDSTAATQNCNYGSTQP
jgi:prepilin-type N-terminal cleavage/methylation domain-containing protein